MEVKVDGKTIASFKDDATNADVLLKATASGDSAEAYNARKAIAAALEQAWRAGVLEPDTLGTIFQRIDLPGGVDAKFPLDFYSPEKEGNYKGFVVPKQGAIPDQIIEGDEIRVPTYKIANAISWSLDYARDARWDVIARALEVFTNGFVRKINDDGWHVVLKAGNTNSQSVVQDASASAGEFTKALLTNMMVKMLRQTGGRNARLTDLYLSPEGLADILNFDDTTVGSIYLNSLLFKREDELTSLFGVRLHELQELGESQEYESFLVTTLGRAHTGGDLEFCVGLDLQHRDSFVMPVRQNMEMYDDPALHRSMKAGLYGWLELGMAALDIRRAIIGSF